MVPRVIFVMVALCVVCRVAEAFHTNRGSLSVPRNAVLKRQRPLSLSMHTATATAAVSIEKGWGPGLFARPLRAASRVSHTSLLGLLAALLFAPLKAAAAKASGAAGGVTAATAVKRGPVWWRVLRKVFKGAGNEVGASAGDSGAFLKGLLNTVQQLATLGGLFVICFFVHKKIEWDEGRKLERELVKLKEYKENMYFDTVEEILGKLGEAGIKGSQKAYLTKQLRDLDPEGEIQDFVKNRSDRPDLSGYEGFDVRPKKKKGSGAGGSGTGSGAGKSGQKLRKPAARRKGNSTAPQPKTTSDKGNSTGADEDASFIEDDTDRASPPPPPPSQSRSNDSDRGVMATRAQAQAPSKRPAVSRGSDTGKSYGASSRGNDDGTAADSSGDRETKLYQALYESLEDTMDKPRRKRLVRYIQGRMASLPPNKRDATLSKVAQKLGDGDYWRAYADKLDL